MPVNDNKPTTEDIVNGFLSSFLSGLGTPTGETETPEPIVDPIAEANRLLKKAEDTGADLIQIADRHIRIVELALAYQK